VFGWNRLPGTILRLSFNGIAIFYQKLKSYSGIFLDFIKDISMNKNRSHE